jgi:hypothetical protein
MAPRPVCIPHQTLITALYLHCVEAAKQEQIGLP